MAYSQTYPINIVYYKTLALANGWEQLAYGMLAAPFHYSFPIFSLIISAIFIYIQSLYQNLPSLLLKRLEQPREIAGGE